MKLSYEHTSGKEVSHGKENHEHVFLIKTNLTKEEVEERLIKAKKNEDEIEKKLVNDPSSDVSKTTSLKKKDKEKERDEKKKRKEEMIKKHEEKKEKEREEKKEREREKIKLKIKTKSLSPSPLNKQSLSFRSRKGNKKHTISIMNEISDLNINDDFQKNCKTLTSPKQESKNSDSDIDK
jgi:hypothetical protein